MKSYSVMTASALFMLLTKSVAAAPYTIPVEIDYTLIKKVVTSQLYKGENKTAELWNDKHGCSFLKLSNLKISGKNGQIQLLNDVESQFGTKLGGQCITLMKWGGLLESWQQPTLSADHRVLSLPVTKAIAYDHQGHQLAIDKLDDLIKSVAEPKLANLKIDLNESRADIAKTLSDYVPPENSAEINHVLDTLNFSSAKANDEGIAIQIAFDAPEKLSHPKPSAPFSDAEQKQWQATWQKWDAFLSNAIQQASDDTNSEELRGKLTQTLKEAQVAFQDGLKAQDANAADPVRVFFTDTWERLAPQLRSLAKNLPEIKALNYLTFIAATDVMYEFEKIGSPFGLTISSDGLRRLARILIAGKQQQAEASQIH